MTSSLRQRKVDNTRKDTGHASPVEEESKKQRNNEAFPNLEPNPFVALSIVCFFAAILGTYVYYKIDHANHGPFADWMNANIFPHISPVEAQRIPLGARAESNSGGLQLTEAQMKQFDGTVDGKRTYLAINGTIFDVSASPTFYGPGGHYHHFAGKDATRAWVTECWDDESQLTWRMDGVEEMFMPKYMDEEMQKAASGEMVTELGDVIGKEQFTVLAKKAIEKFGKVGEEEMARRREEDVVEAQKKIRETLEHWLKFFSNNSKYRMVGSMVLDKKKEPPPRLCEAALKKRPVKGGKLEGLMKMAEKTENLEGKMPDFVKQKLKERQEPTKQQEEENEENEDDDDFLYKDEL